MKKLVNENVFYISDIENKRETYVKSNKEGFWVIWEINRDKTKNTFKKALGVEINRIKCHLTIWNKIFYSKHKGAMKWVDHKENYLLMKLPKIFILNFEKGNLVKHETLKDRYYLNDSKIIKTKDMDDKIICYRYVFVVKDKDIILISKHRRK